MEKVINAIKQEKGYEDFEAVIIFNRDKKTGQLFATPIMPLVDDGNNVERLIRRLNEYGSGLKAMAGEMLQKINKTKN